MAWGSRSRLWDGRHFRPWPLGPCAVESTTRWCWRGCARPPGHPGHGRPVFLRGQSGVHFLLVKDATVGLGHRSLLHPAGLAAPCAALPRSAWAGCAVASAP
eukprot:2685129-Pyramimonas_sp.AAC.1